MTKWETDRAELISLKRSISALREYMMFYQSADPTPEKRKAFRVLVRMSGADVQSVRLLLSVVNGCKENEELVQHYKDKGLIDRGIIDFYSRPENARRLRGEIKELSQLRKQANELLKIDQMK